MRAATVWTIAGICGLVAFGSTLVWRAPKLPPRVVVGGRPSAGPGLIADTLEHLKNDAVKTAELAPRYDLARRYEWAGQPEMALATWRDLASLAEPRVRDEASPRTFSVFALAEAQHALVEGDSGRAMYQRAINLYEARLSERQDPILLYRLGWCARRIGDEAAVTRYFGRLDDLLSAPDAHPDQAGLYMLAASRAMRGYNGQAVGAIEQLIQSEYVDREALEKAEEFQGLRGDSLFMAALAKIGAKRTPGPGE